MGKTGRTLEMAQKTVHYRPGPSTLAQMAVQFGSRPPTFGWTIHFHPLGPSTLDLTRHTLAIDLSQLYSFEVFSSFFFIFSYLFQSKMQKKFRGGASMF